MAVLTLRIKKKVNKHPAEEENVYLQKHKN
jgi:hypothetical protein